MNNVIWYKVWSDLWHNKVRTTLAVFSIAVGVFAVGTIFGMSDQMLVGMDAAHQAIAPSHIRIFLTDYIDRATADRLEHIKGVAGIELMQSVSVRYKLNPDDEWKSGGIGLRDDYEQMRYELLTLKAGQWPDKKQLAVERLSSQYFGIDIGKKVILELEGSDRILPVGGILRDPFVEPPMFGGNAVFYIGTGGLERFNVPKDKFGTLLVQVTPYSPQLAKEVAAQIKDDLAKEGIDVAVTFYQDPVKHWGRRFVSSQIVIMQILAVLSLFSSAVLVLNTMTALITQQTNQIGIMKAVGGTRTWIIKTYLTGAAAYGLLALIIALPLGAFLAFGLTQNFLNIFNIDYNTFQLSPQAVIWQVLAAIVSPLLAALWPVLTGAGMTVRQAIASYGLGSGNFGRSRFDRLVERIGQYFPSGPVALAWGNIFRRKPRLLFTQLVLIIAGVMFLTVMTLSSSINLTLDRFLARRHYDIELNLKNNNRIDRLTSLAESVEGVDGVEVWFQQTATLYKDGRRSSSDDIFSIGAFMYGLPLQLNMYEPPLVAGRWLRPDDGRVVVISEKTAQKNNINVGDTVTIKLGKMGQADWRVVGIFQTVLGGDFSVDPIYAPQAAMFGATTKHNEGDLVYIRTRCHDAACVDKIVTDLKTVYDKQKIEVVDSQTAARFREFATENFNITISMLLSLAVIVALVGGVGLMGALSISVVERTKEIGVMRAIGGRSWSIMGMFMLEGVLQGLVSWALAVSLSLAAGPYLTRILGDNLEIALDYQYNFEAVLIWFIIVLIISILASILPARNATRVSVQQSLAYA